MYDWLTALCRPVLSEVGCVTCCVKQQHTCAYVRTHINSSPFPENIVLASAVNLAWTTSKCTYARDTLVVTRVYLGFEGFILAYIYVRTGPYIYIIIIIIITSSEARLRRASLLRRSFDSGPSTALRRLRFNDRALIVPLLLAKFSVLLAFGS